MFWNLANVLSVLRILLLPIFVFFLLSNNSALMAAAVILCLIIFLLDYVDGWVAHKFKMKTTVGSFLDIVADRIAEAVMWILFVYLELVPFWAPMIILSRGMATDLIRAQAQVKGKAVYDLAESSLAKFLVNSRIMRGLANIKVLVFILATVVAAFDYAELKQYILPLVVASVIVNLARGIPVIWEGRKLFK